MTSVNQLSYVGLAVSDLIAWDALGEENGRNAV